MMKTITVNNNHLLINKSSTEPLLLLCQSPHAVIEIAQGVSIHIIELFVNTNKNTKRELLLQKEAQVEYVKVQDIQEKFHLDVQVNLYEKASLNMINLELGEGVTTNSYETQLHHEFAQFRVKSLVKLFENSNSHSKFMTQHHAKNCLSDIHYKHSLHDKSKATFEAKTVVNNSALYSKAFQNCNTILLSDDATIFSQPHLEILVDELEASHGATTGSLNKDELLYLQSRGINHQKAQEMLLKAFENEIYDTISSSEILTFIKEYKRSNYV